MPNNPPLITDQSNFPRSEFYTRFQGTTIFAMQDPEYWDTYHRSESSRFFSRAGGRKNTQFSSPCIIKSPETHSFSAHSGGYLNPFSKPIYEEALNPKATVGSSKINARDTLLIYKNEMANKVVQHFASLQDNEQKISARSLRPIVYTENKYPCILIQLPVLNPYETKTEAAKYWSKHPKAFQGLLLSSFIAFVNVEAMRANIPIEMVLRASFGHNQPSICSTNNTFRINLGLIPKAYAKLIGKALHHLNQSVGAITDKDSPLPTFSAQFMADVRKYNAKKLKAKILKNKRYESLRDTRDFQKAEQSDTAFDALYLKFVGLNKKKGPKGGCRFQPVILKDKTVWEVIRQVGDSMGKSILSECFREKGTEDWFANQVMELLLAEDETPIETALKRLLSCLSYGETASMNYSKIHKELKAKKRIFSKPSFEPLYAQDEQFSKVVTTLCDAFLTERPSQALYAEFEKAGLSLLFEHTTKPIAKDKSSDSDSDSEEEIEDNFGSSSEFSEDLELPARPKVNYHLSHSKIRVCSGMKAILAAHYGAISYLKAKGDKTFSLDVVQMYFEVEEALTLVDKQGLTRNNVRPKDPTILHYDLNHCNSTNTGDNKNLQTKLTQLKPAIVILDYTSSTASMIEQALYQCVADKNIQFVVYVASGLKNDQGGLDINPYGELRVCARDRATANKVLKSIEAGLSKKDKLTEKTHEIVRVCKKRGLASSFKGLFHQNRPRFKAMEEEKNDSGIGVVTP